MEIILEEYDRATANYLWPPCWVGERPYWDRPDGRPPLPFPDPKLFDEVIATRELPDGVRVRAFRDGMIAFAMGDATPSFGRPDELSRDAFVDWTESAVRLANAHLACIAATRGNPLQGPAEVASLWSVMLVDFESGESHASNELLTGGTRLALLMARNERVSDWRAYRETVVSNEQIERSFELLGALLDRDSDAAVLRAGMLFRATSAFMHRDWTGALMNAWIATEGLLGDLLKRYVDEQRDREPGEDAFGNTHQFIESGRRRFLLGSEMTVRHTIEFLSLLGTLPFELYLACTQCAKARNAWAHSEANPSSEVAVLAIKTLGEMFELVEDVPLHVFAKESA